MSETSNRRAAFDPPDGDVLARMPVASRERLLAGARPMRVPAGAHILEEGADTPFLAVVEAGRVALRLRVPERGTRVTFATVEPGELLGWSALVPPYRASAEAVATEDVGLLAMDAPELRRLLEDEPWVAAELLPIVLEAVAHRLATSWHQLLDTFCARTTGPW